MNQSRQPIEPGQKNTAASNLALYSVAGQVGCLTLFIVFAAVFAGIGLDKLLGTKPVFIILFTLGSAPLALFLTYKLAMRAVKSIPPQEPVSKQPKPVEEDEKGD